MWSKQSANSPWKWIRVKMVHFKSNAIKNPLKNTAIHSYFGQLIAKKSKNNSKTTRSIVCSKTLHWCNVYWQRLHTYILMAAKSSVEGAKILFLKSKTTWYIDCPITLTQRLLTKSATTYFRRLIAGGEKINALRLCTMCTGKCAGRDINRKYIFIYIVYSEKYMKIQQNP